MRRRFLLCVPALLLAGCEPRLDVGADADLLCRGDAECPPGWKCSPLALRCYRLASADREAPRLSGPARVEPPVGGPGATFTVSFAANEPLLAAPSVRVAIRTRARPDDPPQPRELSRTAAEGATFTYTYPTRGDEADGPAPVSIRLIDRAGQVAQDLPGGALVVDCTPPALEGERAVEPPDATWGTPVVVRFRVADTLKSKPRVVVGRSGEATAAAAQPGDGSWRYEFRAVEGEAAAGENEVVAEVEDEAGNPASLHVGTLRLDFAEPAGTFTAEPADAFADGGRPLRAGEVVVLRASWNEEPAGEPAATLRRGGEPALPLETVAGGGAVRTWAHTVVAGEDGDWTLRVDGVSDSAGNVAGAAEPGVFRVDTRAPGFASEPATGAAPWLKEGSLVEWVFETDEPVETPEVAFEMAGGRYPALLAEEAPAGAGTRYRFGYRVAAGHETGPGRFVFALADRAGNHAAPRASRTFQVDLGAPVLSALSASPARAGRGTLLTVEALFDEEIARPTRFEVTPAGGDPGSLAVSGHRLRWSRLVRAGDAEGAVSVRMVVADQAGNALEVDEPVGAVVDVTPPGLADEPPASVPQRALAHDAVLEVEFSADEPLGAPPALAVDGVDADPGPGEGPVWRFTHRVDRAREAEGPHALLATLVDRAGNAAVVSPGTAVYDFSPPALAHAALAVVAPPDNAATACALHYAFDEAQGPADDRVSTGQRLSLAGGARAPGAAGRALLLGPGAGGMLRQAEALPLGSSPRTVAARLRPSALPGAAAEPAPIVRRGAPGARCRGALLALGPGGRPATVDEGAPAGAGCRTLLAPASAALATDRWTHVAVVIEAGGRRLYVDGVEAATDDAALDTQAGPLVVGSPDGAAAAYEGLVDDLRFWARALGPEEIRRAALAPADEPCAFVPRLGATGLAAGGAEVRVTFTLSEPVVGAPGARAIGPGEPLALLPATGPPGAFTRALRLPATGVPAGRWEVEIEATDEAGNSAGPLAAGAFDADAQAPAPPDVPAPGRVVYTRVPWGDPAQGGGPAWRLEGGTGAAEPGSTLLVLDGPDPARATEVARVAVRSDGSFGPAAMGLADRRVLHVAAADAAGNLSPTAEVSDTVWIAGPGGKEPGSLVQNPHRFVDLYRTPAALEPGPLHSAEPSADALRALAATDGASAWMPGGPTWQRIPAASSPPMRWRASIARDAARGVVVLFGGSTSNGRTLADTWEWDGHRWLERTPAGAPSPRESAAAAWDPRRGVVVLFGGADGLGLPLGDTWTWDGTVWREARPAASPEPRYAAAMAYAPAQGRLVLHGGCGAECRVQPATSSPALGDTWEWDGAQWLRRGPPGALPRREHALAADATGRVVLYGGRASGTTWGELRRWDGAAWTELCADAACRAGRPAARWGAGLAAPAGGGLLMFGGEPLSTAGGTWLFDGSAWREAAPAATSPERRSCHALEVNGDGDGLVLYGGAGLNGYARDTQVWRDGAWEDRSAFGVRPPARYEHAMAADRAAGHVVVHGGWGQTGLVRDMWAWNGWRWQEVCGTAACRADWPDGRSGHGLAWDAALGALLLHGGFAGGTSLGDTWLWSGGRWVDFCAGGACAMPVPARRNLAAMFPTAAGPVLFGGSDGASFPGGTWQWDPDAGGWVARPSAAEPAARSSAAVAWEPQRRRAVLFGGFDADREYDDTWEWDAASASWLARPADPRPPARSGALAFHDARRGRTLLFGGMGILWSGREDDLWEWDGAAWRERHVRGDRPSLRSGSAMADDPRRGVPLLFGGYDGDWLDDLWAYSDDPQGRGGLLALFDWSAAGDPQAAVRGVEALARAGGRGHTNVLPGAGSPVDGAELAVWDAGGGFWRTVAANARGPAAPAPLRFERAGGDVGGLLTGGRTLAVRVRPASGQGNGADDGGLAVDAVAARVSYERRSAAAWDFETAGDREGWSAPGLDDRAPAGGRWTVAGTGAPGGLQGPAAPVAADSFTRVRLRAAAGGFDGALSLAWTTDDETYPEQARIALPLPPDGTLHEIEADLGAHPAWSGRIVRVRIVPATPLPGGATMVVDWVRIGR